MSAASSWRNVAWNGIKSAASGRVLQDLKAAKVLPRVVTPQETAEFRQFLDKNVEWPVLDHRCAVGGFPWRDRRGRTSPSAELPSGRRDWDPKELFRDIPTPDGVQTLLCPSQSRHIGLYWRGSRTEPERLVGGIVYRVVETPGRESEGPLKRGEFLAIATAPAYRRRKMASLMLTAMLEDMRTEECEVCQAFIPNSDRLSKPWVSHWLQTFAFEVPERPTREGLELFNTVCLESDELARRNLGLDDERDDE